MPKQFSGIFYEIFVRSFADSNGDGIGDLNGITAKLDYLHDLGIEGIWLSPIFASPSYHKYDVVDYRQIDPEFGSLADMHKLIEEAHRRGIRIILDLVINHSSHLHPWFLEASKSKSSAFRSFYYWMTPEEIKAKGIERRRASDDSGVESPWHWSATDESEKYFGMFWSGMPDLNLEDETLRNELLSIAAYWLDQGVDGFRLDAAKHIFPSWEPMEKAVRYWMNFSAALKKLKPDLYLVGEVWDAPHIVAPFFSAFAANFNIDQSYDLKKLLVAERDKIGLVEKLTAAYTLYTIYKPDFIDATLLSNHDQERIASTLGGNLSKLKQAANLLLTLPGQPYLYYGEELGMEGKKPDEYIREPMPWADTSETQWMLAKYTRKDSPEKQHADRGSLLWHYRNMIALRKKVPALADIFCNLQQTDSQFEGLLCFIRKHGSGDVLVVHNLRAEASPYTLHAKDAAFKYILWADHLVRFENNKYHLPPHSLIILTNRN